MTRISVVALFLALFCLSLHVHCQVSSSATSIPSYSASRPPSASASGSNTPSPSSSTSRTPSSSGSPSNDPSPSPSRSFEGFASPSASSTSFFATGTACSAFPISVGATGTNITLFGTTETGVTVNGLDSSCNPYAKTVWYSLAPNSGSVVYATTCSGYTKIDSVIGVYREPCTNPKFESCSEESSCSYREGGVSVEFEADGGEYYIGVSSEGNNGNFELYISVSAAPVSSCETAELISGPYTSGGQSIIGTLELAAQSSTICGYSTSSQPAWYKIEPVPYIPLTVSTCSSVTTFDTRLSIYTGNCDNTFCAFTNDDNCTSVNGLASEIEFTPTNSTYYVVVSGYGGNVGDYQLSVSQKFENAAGCDSAFPVSVGPQSPFFTEGSTINSVPFGASICGSEEGPAAWYHINFSSTGSVVCNTCQDTDFDSKLYVYTGSCVGLSCFDYNDDGCGNYASEVSFNVNANEKYYVVVAGYDGDTGTYGLNCYYN